MFACVKLLENFGNDMFLGERLQQTLKIKYFARTLQKGISMSGYA